MSRAPIRTVQELGTLDSDDLVAGYHSGRAGDDEPGDNHSLAYWHGWRSGISDRTGVTDDAQRQLAHEVVSSGYLRSEVERMRR